MPALSKRQRILEAFRTRLEAIRLDDSEARFFTDVGWCVYLQEFPELGPEDPDAAVAIVLPEDEVPAQMVNVVTRLPIEIHALAKVGDASRPWETVEAVLADIRRAIELEDRTLGGLLRDQMRRGPTKATEREPGSTTVGASITYPVLYVEGWGD